MRTAFAVLFVWTKKGFPEGNPFYLLDEKVYELRELNRNNEYSKEFDEVPEIKIKKKKLENKISTININGALSPRS